MADLLDHMNNSAPSEDGALNGQELNYTSGISPSDGGETGAIQPIKDTKHPVCPWCWEPLAETSNRDGVFRGVVYIGRTYRCGDCRLTLYANQDPELLEAVAT